MSKYTSLNRKILAGILAVAGAGASLITVNAVGSEYPSTIDTVGYLLRYSRIESPLQSMSEHKSDEDTRLAPLADQFFAGDGSAWTSAKWGAAAGGPFNSSFTAGNTANFATVNGSGTGGSITVAGINSVENFTLTSASGTVIHQGNGVIPINVVLGRTLDLFNQGFTNSRTAGQSFTGPGVLATAGGSYGGGFTIHSGTLIARGVNAMGGNAANTLTINGGTIAANDNRDFSGKYGSGINVGGDFQLGALAADVSLSNDTATLTFSNNVALGSSTRTITIGGNGIYNLDGVISGAPNVGLTLTRRTGSTGRLRLRNANEYTGNTRINSGILALDGIGSIATSPLIEIGGGGTFDVTQTTTAVSFANSQTLRASGSISSGIIATTGTRGLTLGANSPVHFTAFQGATPPLLIQGAGTVTVGSGNSVTVDTTSALIAGNYVLISKGSSGAVAGAAPSSVIIGGSGIASGTTASLVISGGQLVLQVVASPVEITVEEPPGTNRDDGEIVSFGNQTVLVPTSKTFTIRNSGTVNLSITKPFSLDGMNASDYTVDTTLTSASLIPGASTTFTVSFTAGGVGAPHGGDSYYERRF